MARSGQKRQAVKAPKGNVRAPTPTTAVTEPPKPFTLAPAKFSEFLETLPKDGFYLTHIDRTPSDEKRQLFMAPAILNLVFAGLILLRLYYAIPTYISLLSAFFGYDSDSVVDTTNLPRSELFTILISRAGLLILDYSLYTLLGRWILRFVLEETRWRYSIGFREDEVVVRVSKKWHKSLPAQWSVEDERRIADKVLPAMDDQRLQKSALQLVDASFVLDTNAMVDAHTLIDRGDLTLSDFNRVVLVYYVPLESWMMWSLAKPVAPMGQQDTNLAKLRENLAAKGKENLFFRYVEILQYEAERPGGFLVGYQQRAWEELRKAFAEKGVDLAQVRKEMGGERNMPFFEDVPEDHL